MLVGALGRRLALAAGQRATVHFVVCWHFLNLTLRGVLKGRHYARRFASALTVAGHVVEHFERLSGQTRLWRDTWYDSTLPHWFLNRTFANTSILATTTCYRLQDGRFWAWEGIGCCEGTGTHVWHYAQAVGRLFPEFERDLRERVDFGLAMDQKTGVIRFRGEFNKAFAVDGQAGIILRAYREHQMSADDAFLKKNWPHVKKTLACLIAKDSDADGILFGPLHNTLDADWFGVVPWLVGLYHAALRAGEEMAAEVGDKDFARRCRTIFDQGLSKLDQMTWNKEYGYYVHVGDPKRPSEVGSYDGCQIDQVLGAKLGLPGRLGPGDEAHVRQALRSLGTCLVGRGKSSFYHLPQARGAAVSGEAVKEVAKLDAQDAGDEPQIQEGEVSLAAFYRADEGAMESAAAGQFRLRPVVGQPVLADPVSDFPQEVLVGKVHT